MLLVFGTIMSQSRPIPSGSSDYNGDLYHRNGDLGVGIISPSAKLHIVHPSLTGPSSYWSNDYLKIEKEIFHVGLPPIYTYESKLILKQNGNLGINTNNPLEKLHINGNGIFNGNLTIGDNNWTSLTLDGTGDNNWMINAHSDQESLHFRGKRTGSSSFDYLFTVKRTDRRIGINNANPSATIHAVGGANTFLYLENKNTSYGTLVKLGAVSSNNRKECQLQFEERFGLYDHSAGSWRFQIEPNGNVKIGSNVNIAYNGKVQIGNQTITSGTHNTADVKLTVDGHAIF
ncbi:MAG: hypothetical protein KDE33_19540, partial [Bacteroidetes bacterium]|nr:hypothetical protein [Bacteroidota bacterium]